jgi:hypothetical protein
MTLKGSRDSDAASCGPPKGGLHWRSEWCGVFKGDVVARAWMSKCEVRGVQAQAIGESQSLWRRVEIVSENREADVQQVQPQLMAASGLRCKLQSRAITEPLQYTPTGL